MDVSHPPEALIPVRSHRRAMDWSLVLLSQGIECSILHDDLGWRLRLAPEDHARAVIVLDQYRRENRGWVWREQLSAAGADIHWGVLLWCLLLASWHAWVVAQGGGWRLAGQMDSVAMRHGDWWRLFTAVTLHGDVAHLMANLTAGFLTLGLAMTRWGAGWALLAAGFAGAFGNVCGLVFHPEPHVGLGASGMVMGGLGLLTVPEPSPARNRRRGFPALLRSLLGGTLLFVLLGLNPASDVVAHAGGFAAGLACGFALSVLPPALRQPRAGNWFAALLGLCLFSLCWVQALK
jgi:rhomboid protease GluP